MNNITDRKIIAFKSVDKIFGKIWAQIKNKNWLNSKQQTDYLQFLRRTNSINITTKI